MWKLNKKLWALLSLCFVLFQDLARAADSSYGGFIFSNQIPADHIELIKEDINFAYSLPTMRDSNNFQLFSEMKVINGPHIHNWLVNRIRYFIPEQIDFETFFGLTGQDYKYLTPPSLPTLYRRGAQRSDVVTVLATNLGGALYLYGRQNKNLGTVTINGKTKPILSPRIGVIQLGDAYFSSDYSLSLDLKSVINRFYRLSTLLHEARHSDGNGQSTGFLHVKCPKGHAYEDERACDKYKNGAYGLEARFNRVLSKNCRQCSVSEIEVLRVMSLDNLSRLILPTTDQDKVKHLRHALSTFEYILKLCETTKDEASCSPKKMKENTQKHAEIRNQIEELFRNRKGAKPQRTVGDSRPEGFFEEFSIEQTREFMQK